MKEPSLIEWKVLQLLLKGKTDSVAARRCDPQPSSLMLFPDRPWLNDRVTARAINACMVMIKRGWLVEREDESGYYSHYILSGEGVHAAMSPRPETGEVCLPDLNERDLQILREIVLLMDCVEDRVKTRGVTPRILGGIDGGDTSRRLGKLARRGLVRYRHSDSSEWLTGDRARKEPSVLKRGKGSKRYLPTKEGIEYYRRLRGSTGRDDGEGMDGPV